MFQDILLCWTWASSSYYNSSAPVNSGAVDLAWLRMSKTIILRYFLKLPVSFEIANNLHLLFLESLKYLIQWTVNFVVCTHKARFPIIFIFALKGLYRLFYLDTKPVIRTDNKILNYLKGYTPVKKLCLLAQLAHLQSRFRYY